MHTVFACLLLTIFVLSAAFHVLHACCLPYASCPTAYTVLLVLAFSSPETRDSLPLAPAVSQILTNKKNEITNDWTKEPLCIAKHKNNICKKVFNTKCVKSCNFSFINHFAIKSEKLNFSFFNYKIYHPLSCDSSSHFLISFRPTPNLLWTCKVL